MSGARPTQDKHSEVIRLLTEQNWQTAFDQSVRQMQSALLEVEALANRLNRSDSSRAQGRRLQNACHQIEDALQNMSYLVQQRQIPASKDEIELGQLVQQSVTEIPQI
jgi:hypothetical protein